jgi:hypothetical protein
MWTRQGSGCTTLTTRAGPTSVLRTREAHRTRAAIALHSLGPSGCSPLPVGRARPRVLSRSLSMAECRRDRRYPTMKTTLRPLMFALVAALCVLAGARRGPAHHLGSSKSYRVVNPTTAPGAPARPVRDVHESVTLELFANPVRSASSILPGQVFSDQQTGATTWWRINPTRSAPWCSEKNQFGDQTPDSSGRIPAQSGAEGHDRWATSAREPLQVPCPDGNPVSFGVVLRDQWDAWGSNVANRGGSAVEDLPGRRPIRREPDRATSSTNLIDDPGVFMTPFGTNSGKFMT